jgi:hypothetical protein
MDQQDLTKRIQRLEDIEAIKQLKATYCAICDDNHNPDRITTIFAEDGEWEGRGIGHAKGHAAIRELFVGFQKAIAFSQHMVMNPVIEVDGDRARNIITSAPSRSARDSQARSGDPPVTTKIT